jgi:hypothetical protein
MVDIDVKNPLVLSQWERAASEEIIMNQIVAILLTPVRGVSSRLSRNDGQDETVQNRNSAGK